MNRVHYAVCVLVLSAFWPAPTAVQAASNSDQVTERRARQLAEELLQGKSVTVRLYKDLHTSPAKYEHVTIPLKGLNLEFSALASAIGSIDTPAVVVVLGSDQSDEIVSTILGDFIFAGSYRPDRRLHLWPPRLKDPGHTHWTFLDALGKPIPNATVTTELWVSDGTPDGAGVLLGTSQLDGRGRLTRLGRGSGARFAFTLSHPDYGQALVADAASMSITQSPHTYCVFPLVHTDDPAASHAISGFVLDDQDRPVASAEIDYHCFDPPNQIQIYRGGCHARALTDEQGWFRLLPPTAEGNTLSPTPLPLRTHLRLFVEPPKGLNLRRFHSHTVTPGTEVVLTLARMHADEYFHTFAFEYLTGPVTDPEQLTAITLRLMRDDNETHKLTYEQFKAGCYLPTGALRAFTQRWGQRYAFQEVELTPDSPEHIVFRPQQPALYVGSVLDSETGEPMPDVLVLADDDLQGDRDLVLEDVDYAKLRQQALEQGRSESDQILHQHQDRVTITDENGQYEILFYPGFNTALWFFTAVLPGYKAEPIPTVGDRPPSADGTTRVPPIRMSPPEVPYRPIITVYDEAGPVEDPNKLRQVSILAQSPDGSSTTQSYESFTKVDMLWPGTYSARALWGGKLYLFEPVDATAERPDAIVFRPKQIIENKTTYHGQVVHGLTGQPMPGVLVFCMDMPLGNDGSSLTGQQWAALKAIAPDPQPDDPGVKILLSVLAADGRLLFRPPSAITLTDANGQYEIALGPEVDLRRAFLRAMDRGFLNAELQLEYVARKSEGANGRPTRGQFERGSDEIVTLPPMTLFPAGTVTLRPVIPNFGLNKRHRLRLSYKTARDDPTPWLGAFWRTTRDGEGSSVRRKSELQPNQTQAVYIPAGVELTLSIYCVGLERLAPIFIEGLRLTHGQVLDLGDQQFPRAVRVQVRVVDSAGRPVPDVWVVYIDQRGGASSPIPPVLTDINGVMPVYVPHHCRGRLTVSYFDRTTNQLMREGVRCQVGDQEDTDKQFLLQLPDEFIAQLRIHLKHMRP